MLLSSVVATVSNSHAHFHHMNLFAVGHGNNCMEKANIFFIIFMFALCLSGIYSGNAGKFNVTIPASEATIQLLSNDGVAERRVNGRFFIKSSIGDL